MSTEHTQGEWEVSDRGMNIMIGDAHLAMVNTRLPEARANARLIAAAPGLLIAAKSDLDAFERIVGLVDDIRNGSDLHNMLDLIFDLASMPAAADAIAKARGQS